VLFFDPRQSYQVSHPVAGGDASLSLVLSEPVLRELAPRSLLNDGGDFGFGRQQQRIDSRAQALVALLRIG
jgi:AraC family transcriptional regulator